MKIISKYKDYYDYLMGVRGVDPLVVLDRREGFTVKTKELRPAFNDKWVLIHIAICGKVYTGMKRFGFKLLWGEARMPYLEERKSWGGQPEYFVKDNENTHIKLEPENIDANDRHGCPILLLKDKKRRYEWITNSIDIEYEVEKYPKLSELGIQKIYPAEDIYNDISNWISKHNEVEVKDNRTDKEKIENAGFDKTTSFRNM